MRKGGYTNRNKSLGSLNGPQSTSTSALSLEETEWRTFCDETTEATVIRSLRRRLWQAFANEDAPAAYFCYTATRADWDDWMRCEIQRKLAMAEATAAAAVRRSEFAKRRSRRFSSRQVPLPDESLATEQSRVASTGSIAASTLPPSAFNAKDDSSLVRLLQHHMSPTDLFVPDDYKHPQESYLVDDENENANTDSKRKGQVRGKRRTKRDITSTPTLRQAFAPTATRTSTKEVVSSLIDSQTTTPLHEAVRLGHLALVKCMLEHPQVDCDARNGHGRSILHCAAGGFTALEIVAATASQSNGSSIIHNSAEPEAAVSAKPMTVATASVGIRAPNALDFSEEEADDVAADTKSGRIGKAARALGRWLGRHKDDVTAEISGGDTSLKKEPSASSPAFGSSEYSSMIVKRDDLKANRMDIISLILRWTRNVAGEDDDEDRISLATSAVFDPLSTATQGVSVNAVDQIMGRTALHYAAELGRTALCEAILQSFYGTMLTVIDCTGRTPCELAAASGFTHLASYLEARALLFVDPYGTDEGLLAAMIEAQNLGDSPPVASDIVPPFSWFKTLTLKDVQNRREKRITQATEKMREIAARLRIRHVARKTIFEHTQAKAQLGPPSSANDELDNSDEDFGFDVSTFQPIRPDTGTDDLPDDQDYFKFEQLMHEGHVEIYLTHHKWNVKEALDAFSANPFEAFDSASILIPGRALQSANAAPQDHRCLICLQEFETESKNWKQLTGCCHSFCIDCLGDYVMDCANSKSGLDILCPHHECKSVLSPSELALLCPSNEIYCKVIASANDNYIISSNDMRFCPHPGCGQTGAVKLTIPDSMKSPKLTRSGLLQLVGAVCTNIPESIAAREEVNNGRTMPIVRTYDGVYDSNYYNLTNLVQPKRAHRFCYQCGDFQMHWPVSCERLAEWKATIVEQIKDVVDDEVEAGKTNFNDVAQRLWMKANTRPCPQCKAPIEKSDGCNHMTCSNPHCKFEFCWICMCDWQLHNTETGGYFRCNRWVEQQEDHVPYGDLPTDVSETAALLADTNVDPSTMDITYGTAMHESRVAKKRSMDMNRFLHHYARWNAHEESSALERAMRDTVCVRLASVVREAIAFHGDEYILDGQGLSFIHDAFVELVECRSMLRHSYAFSFFRYKSTSAKKYKLPMRRINEKLAFEQFQSELELMTEQTSDVVARSHIRATRTQIRFLTAVTAEKRKEFSNVMINILLEEQKNASRELKKQFKSNAALASGGTDTIVGLTRGGLADGVVSRAESDESNESDDMAAALVRESLHEFLSNTGTDLLYEYTSDDDDNAYDSVVDVGGEWACIACTFVNAGWDRCNMCGTSRSTV